jgi:NitT/TauT family transport system ATP-binding protein
MKISVTRLSFGFTDKLLFDSFNLEIKAEESPLVVLGPSGSGKTTLLKLLAGLLIPQEGEITFSAARPQVSCMFQEPRLLPWLTVLENVSIPLEKSLGKIEAQKRARQFLSFVSLEEKAHKYPAKLSGGQAQRVSFARAFAWPSPLLFMDEPFQSLDIPLRVKLMDMSLNLSAQEKRLLVAVTHDPREAIYLGGRLIILGRPCEGLVFDRVIGPLHGKRSYGCAESGALEQEIIEILGELQ